MAEACREIGFFVVVGHGVPAEVFSGAHQSVRAFFDLALEEKETCRPADGGFLGYFGLGTERGSTSRSDLPDLKERFAMGRCDAHPGAGQNLWPRSSDSLQRALCDYYRWMERFSGTMMRSLAGPLGVEANYFEDKIDRQLSYLAALNYPSLQGESLPGMRASAHRDRPCLTFLSTVEAVGVSAGLEVERDDGSWEGIPVPSGSLVVNVGSMLALWTGGAWKAALHRVSNPTEQRGAETRRQSLAYFFSPNPEVILSPFPFCVDPGSPPSEHPLTVAQHLQSMLEFHARGKGAT